MNPYDELLYQVAIPVPDEDCSEQDSAIYWPDQPSDQSLNEGAAHFLDDYWDNQMALWL